MAWSDTIEDLRRQLAMKPPVIEWGEWKEWVRGVFRKGMWGGRSVEVLITRSGPDPQHGETWDVVFSCESGTFGVGTFRSEESAKKCHHLDAAKLANAWRLLLSQDVMAVLKHS